MKTPNTLIKALVLVALLFSQTSSALAYAVSFSSTSSSSDTHCTMQEVMQESMQEQMHANMSDVKQLHMHQQMNEHHEAMDSEMDCCDSDIASTCCGGQCECIALSTVAASIPTQVSDYSLSISTKVFTDRIFNLHSAFSTLLIRPPISSFY